MCVQGAALPVLAFHWSPVPGAHPWEEVSRVDRGWRGPDSPWSKLSGPAVQRPPYPLAVTPTVLRAQAHTILNSVHKCPSPCQSSSPRREGSATVCTFIRDPIPREFLSGEERVWSHVKGTGSPRGQDQGFYNSAEQ